MGGTQVPVPVFPSPDFSFKMVLVGVRVWTRVWTVKEDIEVVGDGVWKEGELGPSTSRRETLQEGRSRSCVPRGGSDRNT